jgi:hypothetical protein
VRAFEPRGPAIAKVSFFAYGTLRWGVKPAGGDVDGDGFDEILTTPGPGAVFGPHVRAFDYDGVATAPIPGLSFWAFATPTFGANAAAASVDGDGPREIVAAPGPGAAHLCQVRGFDVVSGSIRAISDLDVVAFAGLGYGGSVGAADVEVVTLGRYGDGFDEIAVCKGPGPSYDATMRLFDHDAAPVALKCETATAWSFRFGGRISGGDADAGDAGELVLSAGPDPAAPSAVRLYELVPRDPWTGQSPALEQVGPDDFVAFSAFAFGTSAAIGTFE